MTVYIDYLLKTSMYTKYTNRIDNLLNFKETILMESCLHFLFMCTEVKRK